MKYCLVYKNLKVDKECVSGDKIIIIWYTTMHYYLKSAKWNFQKINFLGGLNFQEKIYLEGKQNYFKLAEGLSCTVGSIRQELTVFDFFPRVHQGQIWWENVGKTMGRNQNKFKPKVLGQTESLEKKTARSRHGKVKLCCVEGLKWHV